MTPSPPAIRDFPTEQEMYEIARFVGIPGEQMSRLIGILQLSGWMPLPAAPSQSEIKETEHET
jgi:hypothetical protein